MSNKSFHLFETLTKLKLVPEFKDKMIRLNDVSDLDCFDNFYENQYNFSEPMLEQYKSGWIKYSCYFFNHPISIHNRNYRIRNILHLLHSSEPDIIICRIIKYNKKEDRYVISYLISQKNKEQICRNIVEMNLSLKNGFGYEGRQLFKSDFEPEKDNQKCTNAEN